jgi:hypothetical protein
MPRHSTLPTLYDECKSISTSFLKKHGFLEEGLIKTGSMTWSRNGNKTGSIGFTVNTFSDSPYIQLNYTYGEESVSYLVKLVSVPSNLGKGFIIYFLCPLTNKRCRKLYLISGKFLHRKAFRGCFYEKQTYSHRNRNLSMTFEKFFGSDKAYELLYSKYFKTHYAGKPTKRYLKLMKMISISNQINPRIVEKYF